MPAGVERGAAAEWRQHWPVVLAACAGMGLSTITTYATGLFIEPLQQEFGWSRVQIMSGHAFVSTTAVFAAPIAGILVDRIGPRRIGIAAVIAMCLAVMLLSLSGPDIWQWRALWVPVAFAQFLTQTSVWGAAIASLFSRGRGLALAVMLCGSSIGSIVTPRLTLYLIDNLGWRLAWVGIAVIWGAIVLPLIWFFFSSARDSERLTPRLKAASAPLSRSSVWQSILQSGMFTRRYPQLLLAGTSIAGVVVTMTVSMVPVLQSSGIGRGDAVAITSMIGFTAIAGRLTIGTLLDRMDGRLIAAACVSLPILGLLILIHFPGSVPAAYAAALIFGCSLGAELDIVAYLTSRYFRLENFGLLFGTIVGFIGLAAGNVPLALHAVYDSTGSYAPALWAAMPFCLLSALLFLLLGPYPSQLAPKEAAA